MGDSRAKNGIHIHGQLAAGREITWLGSMAHVLHLDTTVGI